MSMVLNSSYCYNLVKWSWLLSAYVLLSSQFIYNTVTCDTIHLVNVNHTIQLVNFNEIIVKFRSPFYLNFELKFVIKFVIIKKGEFVDPLCFDND